LAALKKKKKKRFLGGVGTCYGARANGSSVFSHGSDIDQCWMQDAAAEGGEDLRLVATY
jgi:hypothetical protein